MKKTFFLLLILLFPQTIFADPDNNLNEKACATVLCLYGEAEGIEAGEECKLVLENYYSINQNSERNSCEETKKLRKLFLNSCKENISPVDNLVNCLF
jgi:hypothetical protein